MVNSKADIICLSETWLKKGLTSTIINIPGYRLTHLDRDWEVNKKKLKSFIYPGEYKARSEHTFRYSLASSIRLQYKS